MNKIAILTGAGGQLGKGFLNTLKENRYFTYAIDLRVSGIRKTPLVMPLKLDITSEREVNRFYRSLKRVDLLINNAGIGVFTPFEKRTVEEFMAVTNVNMLGTFLMSREAIKMMKKQKTGKIINIGSIYGQVSSDPRVYGDSGRNNSEVYSMSKAGVIMLTKYVAAHFGKYNIQCNCISPGGIFNKQAGNFVRNYINKTPMGRMANVRDLQGALKFIMSKDADYMNGQNITVDGAFTAW